MTIIPSGDRKAKNDNRIYPWVYVGVGGKMKEIKMLRQRSTKFQPLEVGMVVRMKDGPVVVTEAGKLERIVDGFCYGRRYDDGWEQKYTVRPATAEEAEGFERETRVAGIKSELRVLSTPPDDDRDRERIAEEKRVLEAELKELEK